MTAEESIKILIKEKQEWERVLDVDDCYWNAEKPISAYDAAIDALEKQIPKKVVRKVINAGFNLPMPINVNVCPCCGIDTPNPRDLQMWEWWCPDCGQRLDWSEEE